LESPEFERGKAITVISKLCASDVAISLNDKNPETQKHLLVAFPKPF